MNYFFVKLCLLISLIFVQELSPSEASPVAFVLGPAVPAILGALGLVAAGGVGLAVKKVYDKKNDYSWGLTVENEGHKKGYDYDSEYGGTHYDGGYKGGYYDGGYIDGGYGKGGYNGGGYAKGGYSGGGYEGGYSGGGYEGGYAQGGYNGGGYGEGGYAQGGYNGGGYGEGGYAQGGYNGGGYGEGGYAQGGYNGGGFAEGGYAQGGYNGGGYEGGYNGGGYAEGGYAKGGFAEGGYAKGGYNGGGYEGGYAKGGYNGGGYEGGYNGGGYAKGGGYEGGYYGGGGGYEPKYYSEGSSNKGKGSKEIVFYFRKNKNKNNYVPVPYTPYYNNGFYGPNVGPSPAGPLNPNENTLYNGDTPPGAAEIPSNFGPSPFYEPGFNGPNGPNIGPSPAGPFNPVENVPFNGDTPPGAAEIPTNFGPAPINEIHSESIPGESVSDPRPRIISPVSPNVEPKRSPLPVQPHFEPDPQGNKSPQPNFNFPPFRPNDNEPQPLFNFHQSHSNPNFHSQESPKSSSVHSKFATTLNSVSQSNPTRKTRQPTFNYPYPSVRVFPQPVFIKQEPKKLQQEEETGNSYPSRRSRRSIEIADSEDVDLPVVQFINDAIMNDHQGCTQKLLCVLSTMSLELLTTEEEAIIQSLRSNMNTSPQIRTIIFIGSQLDEAEDCQKLFSKCPSTAKYLLKIMRFETEEGFKYLR